MGIESEFLASIKKRITEYTESIAGGHASSYDAYRYLVGQRQGLIEALDIFDDLLKEKDTDDSSADPRPSIPIR